MVQKYIVVTFLSEFVEAVMAALSGKKVRIQTGACNWI